MLTVLTSSCPENVALGDVHAGQMVALFSGGITGMMFLLGGLGTAGGAAGAVLWAVHDDRRAHGHRARRDAAHGPGLFGSLHIMVGGHAVHHGRLRHVSADAVRRRKTLHRRKDLGAGLCDDLFGHQPRGVCLGPAVAAGAP